MDTRMNLFLLIDYANIYDSEKNIDDAIKLLEGISTEALINYISGFSTHLYLNENTNDSGLLQASLVDSLLLKCGDKYRNRWIEVINAEARNGNSPLLIWEFSNLKFYNLIFNNYNNFPCRDLTNEEARKVYDAYLIINSIVNNKTKIDTLDKDIDQFQEHIEEVTIPNFIYQKDYSSTIDFSNQITRGILLFEYLETHPKYKNAIQDYYAEKKVSGYLKMYKSLMILFTELGIGTNNRKQLANLEEYAKENLLEIDYINSLSINKHIVSYQEDDSFSLLRSYFLFKHNDYKYYILNINFIIDQFYKAQVFSINNFFKENGVDKNFLSNKAKEFMEEIYLPKIISACFPDYIKYFNDNAINSKGEELCDAYFRKDNKMCLIEFKDVLLNARIKNLQDKELLYDEFDKKFDKNQKGKPKGITQILNAIEDIIDNRIIFDTMPEYQIIEIYPVIVYTDFSFSVDGLNAIFKKRFKEKLKGISTKNYNIHDITFINLSYFELHEEYLAKGILNIFDLINRYQNHISKSEYRLTPFEVFSRFFMKENVKENFGLPKTYNEILETIVKA
ncbi:hypothetical protein [Yeosuana sp.]|uniref:hypothetical protein n=1 Tax=Yeosuana sp. TaxID=2529388 RepID=UPI004054BD55